MIRNQKGFSIVEVFIVLVIVGLLGLVAWKVFLGKKDQTANSSPAKTTQKSSSQNENTDEPARFIWQQTATGLQSSETPPACPDQPILKAPANINKVTAVLYPGQTRGDNYKPHGGFRFDTTLDNKITVTAPMDGYLVRGGSYIAEGEIQYTFDAMNNCGIMYRVGHLRELPENLQKIADTWPAPSASSATQPIHPGVFIKQGGVLATKVGILKTSNVFFDLGIYDYRQQNEASKSAAYQTAHSDGKELAWHAVCWIKGWLPVSDQSKLLALPAGDPTSGKKSDYCE